MRVLELSAAGRTPFRLELHPRLTVLPHLPEPQRRLVLKAFERLARGGVPPLQGVLELDGTRFDLDDRTLPAVLGLTRNAPDPVVRSADLPGFGRRMAAASARRQAAETGHDQVQQRLVQSRARLEAARRRRQELVWAVGERRAGRPPAGSGDAATVDARATARDEVLDARRAIDAAGSALAAHRTDVASQAEGASGASERAVAAHATRSGAVARLQAAIEAARRALDPTAFSALAEVAAEVAASSTMPTGGPPDPPAAWAGDPGRVDAMAPSAPPPQLVGIRLAERIAHLEAEHADALATVAAMGVGDAEVAAALRGLEALGGPEARVADARGADAGGAPGPDRSVRARSDPEPLPWEESPDAPSDDILAAARRRVARAGQVLQDLERGDVPSDTFDLDVVTALEATHAAMLAARSKVERRLGGVRAERRLSVALSGERRLLDQLGFASYADFAMSASTGVGADTGGRIATARVGLAQAEEELADLEKRAAEASTGAVSPEDTPGERRAAAAEQRTLDAASAPGPPDGGDRGAPEELLARVLRAAGADVGGPDVPLEGDALISRARRWLDDHHQARSRLDQLAVELDSVDSELVELWDRQVEGGAESVTGPDDAFDPHPAQSGPPSAPAPTAAPPASTGDGPGGPVLRLAELHVELHAREARAAVHGDAVTRAADLEVALGAAVAEAAAAAAMVDRLAAERAAAAARAGEEERHLEAALAAAAGRLATAQAAQAAEAVDDAVDADADVEHLERRLVAVGIELAEARIAHQLLVAELAAATERVAHEVTAEAAARIDAEQATDLAADLEAIEWCLLVRLASQRSVATAGSVPLVLDDPFRHLPPGAAQHLVAGLERLASAVQLVVVGDDAELVTWARELGADRAVVVARR